MAFSYFLGNNIFNYILRNSTADFLSSGNLYFALCTAAPTQANTGSTIVETNYVGYSRVAISRSSGNFDAATAGETENTTVISFPICSGGSSTITHLAITDSSSGGNLLMYGELASSVTVSEGDVVKIRAGEVDFNI